MSLCVFTCHCVCLHVTVSVFMSLCVCLYHCVCLCHCVFINVAVYMSLCVFVSLRVCVTVCVCVIKPVRRDVARVFQHDHFNIYLVKGGFGHGNFYRQPRDNTLLSPFVSLSALHFLHVLCFAVFSPTAPAQMLG